MSAKKINTRKHTNRKHAKVPGEMPSRDDILAFVADNPGRAGKREIARHFGIIGGARIHLNKLLKDLTDDGLMEKRQRKSCFQFNDNRLIFTAHGHDVGGADFPLDLIILAFEKFFYRCI